MVRSTAFQGSGPCQRSAVVFAVALAVVALSVSSCSAGATQTPEPAPTPYQTTAATPSNAPSRASSEVSAVTSATSGSVRLLALAGAPSTALWKLENGIWSSAGDASGARSLARDGGRLILAGDQGIELRDVGQPLAEGARQTVDWASALVGGVPSGIDAADDGRVAAALVAGDTIKLVTLDPKNPDVAPRALNPAPASPFGPSVAWLDARRLLVLSTDNMQISRLAVVDTGMGTMGPLSVLGGVRSFALSPSRGLLAVVKDEGVHIATAARWLTGESPALSIESGPEEVFWGVAVDGTDTRMAMFSGTLTADGDVTGVHDIGLELRSGRWTRSFDQSVPFAEAIAQVWLD